MLAPRASNPVAARLGGGSRGVGRVIGQERCSGVSELVAAARKFEISVHTGSEEGFHIVGDYSKCAAQKLNFTNFMTASQVHPERCGRFDLEAL